MRKVALQWVGGEHEFALPIGALRAVQQHCDAGPQEVLDRLVTGKWRVDDLYEVIRQGLIGAGMPTKDAAQIVAKAWDQNPVGALRITAQSILIAALVGVEDDPVGEPEGVETPAPESGDSA